jgi:protoporphyrinogen oxidase
MKTSKPGTIIIGSGLSALMLARMIKAYKDPDAEIVIVERDDKVGGQFSSINYGEHGWFDHGMHIYYESCIPEIDTLFTDLFPENEWNILEDNAKDIAGLFYRGKLQINTPYPDLRTISESDWKKYIADILFTAKKNFGTGLGSEASAYDILEHHFGKTVADEIFAPILEKLYLTSGKDLDQIATLLTTINRVALFDEKIMLDLMQSPAIRSRICFPNQFTLPPYRTTKQRGFYPKKYGMFGVIDKFKTQLEAQGVKFITSAGVTDLKIEDNKVTSMTVTAKNENMVFSGIDKIYWTAGLPSIAAALKIDMSDLKYDKKKTEAYYVNFLFDKSPDMDKLYYFYCFDKDYRSFRITNYSAYCPDAAGKRGYPVCAEIWALDSDPKTGEGICDLALNELKAFGVIKDHKVLFSKAEKLQGGGFPLPSLKNMNNMRIIRERIKKSGITNLISTGVLSEDNVFFIKDVLMDTYKKVKEN